MRLKLAVLPHCVEAGTTLRREDVVPCRDGSWELAVKACDELSERLPLCLGACVLRLSLGVESANVADAYRVRVVV